MKEDLIKLRELITKIITENNLDSIDINNFRGGIELHSRSEYVGIIRIRTGIEIEITLSNENMTLTSSLDEMIRFLGENEE